MPTLFRHVHNGGNFLKSGVFFDFIYLKKNTMNSLELLHLCRKISAIPLNRGIRTDAVLFMQGRRKGVPLRGPKESGIRHRKAALGEDSDFAEDIEHEGSIDDEVDIMNIDKAYDLNTREKAKEKTKVHYGFTSKKFFSPGPEPSMLTHNEREVIRHLHKQDPVQWNFKTLSESFPATTDGIKRIIKSKWKVSPEKVKIIDSRVQRNWELLAEGKLEGNPRDIEHFKKFVNRREVLLEQIKNNDFYLPEVKKEKVWNKGDFTGILSRYEKAVEKLVIETGVKDQPKMLQDGTENEKSSIDTLHEKIEEAVATKSLEDKDSFLFGGMNKFYSKHTTLEQLEEKILKRADRRKKLNIMEKAILENKLGMICEQNVENLPKTEPSEGRESKKMQNLETENGNFMETYRNEGSLPVKRKSPTMRFMDEKVPDYEPPDERTKTTSETGIGKLLENIRNPPKEPKEEVENIEEKPKIDFSDPERLQRENVYYDNEVSAIEDTAFWNSGRKSKEKALAELQKLPHCGPPDVEKERNPAPSVLLSTEAYPERIKIPKDMRGKGLTFKVKDCYYDDDGEFLYRVPGMSK